MRAGPIVWAQSTAANLAAGVAIGIIAAAAVLTVVRAYWLCGLSLTELFMRSAERVAGSSAARSEAARASQDPLYAPDDFL